jgi:aldose sugar dehydrogenase
MVLLAGLAAFLLVRVQLPSQARPETAPGTTATPARTVGTIQTSLCAGCHGAKWEGGRAPSMLDEVWAHGGDDESLAESIRTGFPVNGMPPFAAALSAAEIRGLVISIREARERASREGTPKPRLVDGSVVASELHTFKIELVADGLDTPWGIAFLPDGRFLVTERPGRLRIVDPGVGIVASISGLPRVWLQQDGGLFDVAVHPNYAANGWVYLSFAEPGAQARTSATRVIRGRIRDGALVDQETLFQPTPAQYWESNIHYGSRFFFDRDGYLFFSIGDRGHRRDAQDLTSPYGKLHRVRDDGRPAEGNPFIDRTDAVKSIWSYGNRNIQGIAQHPTTGELWASEHGPRGGDELNLILPGHNYGWPVITYGMDDDGSPIAEASGTAHEGMDQPVVHWTPSIAVAALEFYTGDKFPAWKNQLFATALAGRHLRRLQLEGHTVVHQEVLLSGLGRVRDVVTGPDGFLYLALNSEFGSSPGRIVRLVPAH